jgi:hypothetical protein
MLLPAKSGVCPFSLGHNRITIITDCTIGKDANGSISTLNEAEMLTLLQNNRNFVRMIPTPFKEIGKR